MRRLLSAWNIGCNIGVNPVCAYRDPQLGYLPRTLGTGLANRIIRYRINSWFLSSQLGTFGHTVRDKSLDQLAEKHEIPDAWIEICEMAASPSKVTGARGVTWI
ncbi:helix-hairpin-helix domain-containing protein [Sphingopyxis sp. FD7]|uniref:helix-hairpin-helix domain-containing protein n=1 Tax=Sphingopyxis sp. FD7 TaxID=1914525 RepID=UPI0011BA97EF|nr:helix-hairpin-helix domain-containing protein [Sphingopyxis sp. FD7]